MTLLVHISADTFKDIAQYVGMMSIYRLFLTGSLPMLSQIQKSLRTLSIMPEHLFPFQWPTSLFLRLPDLQELFFDYPVQYFSLSLMRVAPNRLTRLRKLKLHLVPEFTVPLCDLFPSLESLYISGEFNIGSADFPATLRELVLKKAIGCWDWPNFFKSCLPPLIEILKVRAADTLNDANIEWPSTLTSLSLDFSWRMYQVCKLPGGLKRLSINATSAKVFCTDIDWSMLPPQLECLKMYYLSERGSQEYPKPEILPRTLRTIILRLHQSSFSTTPIKLYPDNIYDYFSIFPLLERIELHPILGCMPMVLPLVQGEDRSPPIVPPHVDTISFNVPDELKGIHTIQLPPQLQHLSLFMSAMLPADFFYSVILLPRFLVSIKLQSRTSMSFRTSVRFPETLTTIEAPHLILTPPAEWRPESQSYCHFPDSLRFMTISKALWSEECYEQEGIARFPRLLEGLRFETGFVPLDQGIFKHYEQTASTIPKTLQTLLIILGNESSGYYKWTRLVLATARSLRELEIECYFTSIPEDYEADMWNNLPRTLRSLKIPIWKYSPEWFAALPRHLACLCLNPRDNCFEAFGFYQLEVLPSYLTSFQITLAESVVSEAELDMIQMPHLPLERWDINWV